MAQQKERGVYAFLQKPNESRQIPWWSQNEMSHYGLITPAELPLKGRRFSIAEWVEDSAYRKLDKEPLRFSEADECWDVKWQHVQHPWDEEPAVPIEQFHTAKERRGYLDCRIYDAYEKMTSKKAFGSVFVMHLPFGGLPLVSTVLDGKVTIY